jgi:hypothetical protein
MLHAELHGKIAHDVSDIERREDMLTSTVFGTLFTAGANTTLRAWLSKARTPSGRALEVPVLDGEVDYWFWPRVGATEPDVLIHLGTTLVIVEAKYRSRASGDDQLEREWTACAKPAPPEYRSDIRALIDGATDCVLIYLVQRKRLAKEAAFVAQTLAQVADGRMYTLTWEDLDEVLPARGGARWMTELRRYLRLREITAFRGFGATLSELAPSSLAALSARGRRAWARVIPVDVLPRIATLSTWKPRFEHKP